MREIAVFVEDIAHETIVRRLIARLLDERHLAAKMTFASASGGHGVVVRDLRRFLRDKRDRPAGFPDLIVVATDGNCKGYNERRREVTDLTSRTDAKVVCAIPDPHVERWLMLDGRAFREVIGVGCDAPDQKCERDRYKSLLSEAVRRGGVVPYLGGIEFADDLVAAMDITMAIRQDRSLELFVSEMRAIFQDWAR
jgi:hypothetical protein